MVDGNSGRGDTFRPVNKKKYDEGYLRVFGKLCEACNGTGKFHMPIPFDLPQEFPTCPICDGLGYIEKKKKVSKNGVKCPHCKGRGSLVWNGDPQRIEGCLVCNGIGYVEREEECSNCKGSGKLPLSHCLPGDHSNCPYCNGTGFIEKKK